MDAQQNAEIRDLRVMLNTSGWIVIKRDVQTKIDHLESTTLDVVKTLEDVAYRKGLRDGLRFLLAYESIAQMESESEDEDSI